NLLRGNTKPAEPLPLETAIKAVEDCRTKLSQWPSEFERHISAHFAEVLAWNAGYQRLVRLVNDTKEEQGSSKGPQSKVAESEDTESNSAKLRLYRNAPISALTRAQCFPRFEQL